MHHRTVFGIVMLCLVSAAHGTDAPVEALKEYSCSYAVKRADGTTAALEAPGLSVLNPPSDQPDLVADLDEGVTLESVLCWRSRAEFAPTDYRVLAAGVPLYVKHDDAGPNQGRALVLEWTERGHQVRRISGAGLSDDETTAILKLINEFDARRKADAESSGEGS